MIGQIFGSLVILESRQRTYHRADRPSGHGRIQQFWLVQCSCGTKPFSTFNWRKKRGWSDEEALFGRS